MRTTTPIRRPFRAALLAGLAAACGGDALPPAPVLPAEPPFEGASWFLEFPVTPVGQPVLRTLALRNRTARPLTLELTLAEGAFAVESERYEVDAGDTVDLPLTYLAPALGSAAGVLELRAGAETHEVELRASATPAALECPDRLDFGTIVRGSRTRELRCANRSGAALVVRAEVEGPFGIGPDSERTIEAGESATFAVAFAPARASRHEGTFRIVGPAGYEYGRVVLSGTRAASAIELVKDGGCIDFGFVSVGGTSTRTITVRNLDDEPRAIEEVDLDGPFVLADGPSIVPADDPETPEAENEATLGIAFRPDRDAEALGEVSVVVDGGATGTCLEGYGGGPVLACDERVDFGQVPVGVVARERLRCTNVAGAAEPLRLVLDSIATDGAEFEARLVGEEPEGGFASGESFEIEVEYDSTNAVDTHDSGHVILSGDFVGGEARVPVTALGRVLPACDFELVQSELRFGSIPPGTSGTLDVRIVNRRANECLVLGVELLEGSDAAFHLADDPPRYRSIPGFGELRVPVTFSPAEASTFEGRLGFHVSDGTGALHEVPIGGSADDGCVRIVPPRLDFHAVKPGCRMHVRAFRVVNECDHAVEASVSVDEPSTPEFFVLSPGPQPIAAGSSWQVEIGFGPQDEGGELSRAIVSIIGAEAPLTAFLVSGDDRNAKVVDELVVTPDEPARHTLPLSLTPKDVNLDGRITGEELTIRRDGVPLPSTAAWSFDGAPSLVVTFDVALEPGRYELEYRAACL